MIRNQLLARRAVRSTRVLSMLALATCGLLVTPTRAQSVIGPASDLLTTPANGNTVELHYDVGSGGAPLPAGFFGPGSDPFTGQIRLHGEPLTNGTVAPGGFLPGQADTIVRRLTTVPLPMCPSAGVVPIEIVALSLISIQPITVTYGGLNPTPYQVMVCLPTMVMQPLGTMQIQRTELNGGMFFTTLPVIPKLVFMKCTTTGPGVAQATIDPAPTLNLNTMGRWSYSNLGLAVENAPAGGMVDHDCNSDTPPVPFMPTSNFVVGVHSVGGTCTSAGAAPVKELTPEQETLAAHGVLPPCRPPGTGNCFGDGTGAPCPCGNFGTAGHGCEHSFGLGGALLYGSGEAKVSNDSLLLRAEFLPPTTFVLFFQGTAIAGGGLGAPFGDGLRCASGAVLRLGVKTSSCSKANYGATIGDVPVSIRGAIPVAGGIREYQAWYRNSALFCIATATFNLSNGYEVPWSP